ncbi:MAG TPA: DNA/RNA nuclease SfsA [Dongiaceae bacterium]|jgi:sugar fermentation stimulation protein A|nr:DNA/RNA nuclease SfsA [Dongiaceae bacterium]
MRYAQPLIPATLLRRYKRFLADMAMADGQQITVHCANPGSMLSLAVAGRRCWLSHHPGTGRKLEYSWELEEAATGCIGINTARANTVVAEALAAGAIPELAGWPIVRREVPDGDASRLDFHLSGGNGPDCWLEVKSVTMSRKPGLAEWPDARSSRGARHLEALSRLANGGAKAALLLLVQRPDCTAFRVAGDIDPVYAAAFAAVDRAKVRILAFDCSVSPDGIALRKPLTILRN